MDISEFKFTETFSQNGNHVFLSVHFGDYPPAEFPTHTGLDPIIAGVVIMEVGSYAVYEGIYSGSDAIGINAPGAVRDLGKPQTSGVTVRIGIRKGLTMYVFLADYGTDPVSAPFSELLMHGHYYIPRFTANFNVRRVQIIDTLAIAAGHEGVRLPPYHCELNPLELVCSQVKRYVASKNTDFKIDSVEKLLLEGIPGVTPPNWFRDCTHVIRLEDEAWARERSRVELVP
ncbi:uncharacterized protein LOC125945101 [Dermacentor silvarum]|uniref:uncharacterized protein LOC125945101 n=1 Tax=Dermacentor silvarum TaxID=543639 RepID=UPI002101B27F|nr:uncharacterized protein LOC125945101 [Dermacentor silvarum]